MKSPVNGPDKLLSQICYKYNSHHFTLYLTYIAYSKKKLYEKYCVRVSSRNVSSLVTISLVIHIYIFIYLFFFFHQIFSKTIYIIQKKFTVSIVLVKFNSY